MNKKAIIAIFLMVTFVAVAIPVMGDSAEDYKIIKKALKNKKKGGDIAWFRVEVKERKTRKTTVKIRLPIAVVDMLAECDEDIKIDKCKINLKRIIKDLKKHGPMTLIEIDSDDGYVRIWFE